METGEKKPRKSWNADEKITIIRKHFSKTKLIDTCDENRIHPSMLNDWWKTVLEAGREALLGTNKKEQRNRDRQLEKYEAELKRKNEVIAVLSEMVIDLKKKNGEL